MAQRMGALADWSLLDEGESLSFEGPPRMVAIEVNAPSEVGLFCKADDDDERFIALVKGRDRVEFTVDGNFHLGVEGGEVWYKTVDGQQIVNHEVAPVIFTRIANRKARNHNLEMIEWKMRQNVDARMAAMQEEAERRLHDMEARYAASRRPVVLARADELEPSPEGSEGQGKQSSKAPLGKGGADDAEGGSGGKPPKGGKAASALADD